MSFVNRNQALSSEIKRVYDCIVPAAAIYVDCHSSNIIYLIACNKYHMNYASETVQNLKEKFNGRRTGFEHTDKHRFCKILFRRFNEGNFEDPSCKVEIIKKCLYAKVANSFSIS